MSQWSHDCLKGGWLGESLCLTNLLTCLPPLLVGPLLKLWRIQGKVSTNLKGLLRSLLLWYGPSSWWHRVTCLVNTHVTWWLSWSMDCPPSSLENIALQASSPPPSTSAMGLATFPWWGQRGAASGGLMRLWPHGWVGGACFVALCFCQF